VILASKSRGNHQSKRGENPTGIEEEGGMPQHRHCPPAKRREDRNPKYHEEQQKDVA
jgi:hypothetical protein